MEQSQFSKFDSLPPLLTSQDLVSIGLFSSIDAAYTARLKGKSPDFVQFERKVLYPKECVIDFIKRHTQQGERVMDFSATVSEPENN